MCVCGVCDLSYFNRSYTSKLPISHNKLNFSDLMGTGVLLILTIYLPITFWFWQNPVCYFWKKILGLKS